MMSCLSFPYYFLYSLVFGTTLACLTDLDCSLNGVCQKTFVCSCDLPWIGQSCSPLSELAVRYPQGYGQSPNLTSWGGSILQDPLSGKSHAFISRMTNGCSLSHWRTNSRIDHAISDNVTGPYQLISVAIPTWSHNPAPIKLIDGTFAIFHIGLGVGADNGGDHCSNDIPDFIDVENNRRGSIIHQSTSLMGPWVPLFRNRLEKCNNPAPWQHNNGSLYVVCTDKDKHSLLSAQSIQGTWTFVSTIPVGSGPPVNKTQYEDPFLWVDSRDNWHLLFHAYSTVEDHSQCINSTVSAHLYSFDGLSWHLSSGQPYTTQIKMENETITVSTRERAKLIFSQGTDKPPTHLMTGVCSAPSCPSGPPTGCVDCKTDFWDFTLITPLQVK